MKEISGGKTLRVVKRPAEKKIGRVLSHRRSRVIMDLTNRGRSDSSGSKSSRPKSPDKICLKDIEIASTREIEKTENIPNKEVIKNTDLPRIEISEPEEKPVENGEIMKETDFEKSIDEKENKNLPESIAPERENVMIEEILPEGNSDGAERLLEVNEETSGISKKLENTESQKLSKEKIEQSESEEKENLRPVAPPRAVVSQPIEIEESSDEDFEVMAPPSSTAIPNAMVELNHAISKELTRKLRKFLKIFLNLLKFNYLLRCRFHSQHVLTYHLFFNQKILKICSLRDSNSTLARSKADSVSEKSARSKEVIIEAEIENQVPVDVPVNTPKSENFKLINHF